MPPSKRRPVMPPCESCGMPIVPFHRMRVNPGLCKDCAGELYAEFMPSPSEIAAQTELIRSEWNRHELRRAEGRPMRTVTVTRCRDPVLHWVSPS